VLLLNIYAGAGKWWDLTANVDDNRERKEMWRHSQIVPGLKRMTRDTFGHWQLRPLSSSNEWHPWVTKEIVHTDEWQQVCMARYKIHNNCIMLREKVTSFMSQPARHFCHHIYAHQNTPWYTPICIFKNPCVCNYCHNSTNDRGMTDRALLSLTALYFVVMFVSLEW
jgi:hypothetical protein